MSVRYSRIILAGALWLACAAGSCAVVMASVAIGGSWLWHGFAAVNSAKAYPSRLVMGLTLTAIWAAAAVRIIVVLRRFFGEHFEIPFALGQHRPLRTPITVAMTLFGLLAIGFAIGITSALIVPAGLWFVGGRALVLLTWAEVNRTDEWPFMFSAIGMVWALLFAVPASLYIWHRFVIPRLDLSDAELRKLWGDR